MQKILFICCLLTLFKANAQQKNSVEIGLNGDYFKHRIRYGDIGFSKIKTFNASYTYLLKKVYLKADFSKMGWSSDMDIITYFQKRGRNCYRSFVINSKNSDIINIGAAYAFGGHFKSSLLFFNFSYNNYYEKFFGLGAWLEPDIGERKGKDIGIGLELKQRLPISKSIYAYTDLIYNRYLGMENFKPTFGNSIKNYWGANLGLGYKF